MALENDYDLILLDLMLPGMNGEEVCEKLRERKATPVIMLTAKGEEGNRVQGFEASDADGYIVKPFSLREVVLRVKALLSTFFCDEVFGNLTGNKRCPCVSASEYR